MTPCASPRGHVLLLSIFAVLAVLYVASIVVTAPEGKWGYFLIGFIVHSAWWIAAVRLAKPGSWWATRFYGGEKLARARVRFGEP